MYRKFRDLIYFASGIEVSLIVLAAAGVYVAKNYLTGNSITITIDKKEDYNG